MATTQLSNIVLPSTPTTSTYDITITGSTITSLKLHAPNPSDSPPSLLLPTLCHPHIHLDKPYLLTCNNHHHPNDSPTKHDLPDYSDLAPSTGTFHEALTNTSAAKSRFTPHDLYLRGSQLLATSYTQGVTSARCFIEVDHVTQFKTLEAGLRLKEDFGAPRPELLLPNGLVDVQLCVFAQDPVFSTEHGDENRQLVESALNLYAGKGVSVLGSTPYVETCREASLANIEWAVSTALKYDLHLDFHLDYSLSTPPEDALVWHVLQCLIKSKWSRNSGSSGRARRTVVLGHCTALTNFPSSSLHALSEQITSNNLPVFFVGLPTSDIYMMGRPDPSPTSSSHTPPPLARPRGTLNIPNLIREYGIQACLGVNNVGNAFTPFGSGDPLQLASLGVGLYHAGTEDDAKVLYETISIGARKAIGLVEEGNESGEADKVEDEKGSARGGWEFKQDTKISKHGVLLIRNEEWVGCPGHLGMKVPARQRRRTRDVVWDVPEVELRRVLW